VVYPFVDFTSIKFPDKLTSLGFFLGGEVIIGIVIGYATRLFFTALEVAGHMMGFQIGFGIVNVIDPQTSAQVSIISQFENIIVILFFLSTGAYYMFLKGIVESYSLIPPLGLTFSKPIVQIIVSLFSSIFLIAIKLSAPVMASGLFAVIALGLVARTVPQLNIFIVGMPIQIGLGLFMLGASLSFVGPLLKNIFAQMEFTMYSLLRAM
jgi:flagellar biosynthetic protein FliR